MRVRIYNMITGESFLLDDTLEEIARMLPVSLEEKGWDGDVCKVEIVDEEGFKHL